jgi:hypothetical protein
MAVKKKKKSPQKVIPATFGVLSISTPPQKNSVFQHKKLLKNTENAQF